MMFGCWPRPLDILRLRSQAVDAFLSLRILVQAETRMNSHLIGFHFKRFKINRDFPKDDVFLLGELNPLRISFDPGSEALHAVTQRRRTLYEETGWRSVD